MASIDVTVEVDLDDFNLDEILCHLDRLYSRHGVPGKVNRETIDEFIRDLKNEEVKQTSIINQQKTDLFMANVDKIGLDQLEKIING